MEESVRRRPQSLGLGVEGWGWGGEEDLILCWGGVMVGRSRLVGEGLDNGLGRGRSEEPTGPQVEALRRMLGIGVWSQG